MNRCPVDQPYTVTTTFAEPDSNALFKLHSGYDFSVLVGTNVYAPVSGTVRFAALHPVRGLMVGIFDGCNTHRLMHNSRLLVTVNDTVAAGQLVSSSGGAAGAYGSGLSTGPHVHWDIIQGDRMEARSFNDFIDPLQWLQRNKGGTPMTREALNILAQLAWNKPADEAFLSAYEGKEPSVVLGDVLDSAANIWLRTKASQFDGVWNALQGEYAKDRLSPDATQVIADVQAALDKHKLAS